MNSNLTLEMNLRIMVVDDELDVEFLFNQRFRREIRKGSITILYSHSGEKALSFLREPPPFDIVLVLSDINMPGMTGLELLKLIKKEFPEIKVFMVTACGDDENFKKAKQYGADDFITKPVDFKVLKEKIFQLEISAKE